MTEVREIFRRIWLWVLVGVGLGALSLPERLILRKVIHWQ